MSMKDDFDKEDAVSSDTKYMVFIDPFRINQSLWARYFIIPENANNYSGEGFTICIDEYVDNYGHPLIESMAGALCAHILTYCTQYNVSKFVVNEYGASTATGSAFLDYICKHVKDDVVVRGIRINADEQRKRLVACTNRTADTTTKDSYKLQKFSYPSNMDVECIGMCDIFNSFGMKTEYSCCGHGKDNFFIIFHNDVTTEQMNNFLTRFSKNRTHSPFLGKFSMWERKCGKGIAHTWMYSAPSIEIADRDAEVMLKELK